MKNVTKITALLFIIFSLIYCNTPTKKVDAKTSGFYVANWNVENLFDTIDDVDKFDEQFTPGDERGWNEEKLSLKIDNLARVISDMNNNMGPDILGLEEVEHESVVGLLVEKIKLKKNYEIVHFESPDKRGIDNALIYNADYFTLKKSEALKVNLGGNKTTRDILYAVLDFNGIELNIFVNHWPSRREGLKKSEPNRVKAAERLMQKINNLEDSENSNIIIMGDFNDLPSNISISNILGAKKNVCPDIKDNKFGLYNISTSLFEKGEGTYKYRDHWNMLDQIIISNSFYDKKSIDLECESFEIIKPDYIIQKEGKYKGTSLPTFGGRKYLGGFSDHFSIGAQFVIHKNSIE